MGLGRGFVAINDFFAYVFLNNRHGCVELTHINRVDIKVNNVFELK